MRITDARSGDGRADSHRKAKELARIEVVEESSIRDHSRTLRLLRLLRDDFSRSGGAVDAPDAAVASRLVVEARRREVEIPRAVGIDLGEQPGCGSRCLRDRDDVVPGASVHAFAHRGAAPPRWALAATAARHSRLHGARRHASASVECADFQVLAALAVSGAGVALVPSFLVAAEVTHGRLVRVVPGTTLLGAPLMLVSRPQGAALARGRAIPSARRRRSAERAVGIRSGDGIDRRDLAARVDDERPHA
ncbi:MAG: hypothetical protein KIT84_19610 [Labilithrix sp.]|nr:hypothetical protein [Labilithrix sp.]MCW5813244.1 hypothetical protein [Labilithrix sp.]